MTHLVQHKPAVIVTEGFCTALGDGCDRRQVFTQIKVKADVNGRSYTAQDDA